MKVIGYYPGWATYERNYQVADIPAAKLTHVNYAFANISGGKCVVGDAYADTDKFFPGDSWDAGALRGNFNQLRKLKAANPHLKTLISVGGWTWSSQFSNAALTAASRKTFADSCVSLMKTYGFDGIDIDWEYPVSGGLQNGRPEDKQNFTLLLQALNAALDTQGASDGRDYLLTIAGPAGQDKLANIEALKVAGTVDWINLMTYDYNGNWNSFTGHNAPLSKPTGYTGPAGLYAQATVDAYLATGIPASKLVLGVPFYGRSWSKVGSTNNGLYQAGVTGPGTWEPGMLDYKDIVARYGTAAGYTRYWDASAQVPYLYNKTAGVFVSYDDPQSLQAKAQYAVQKGLGGAMIWELSADTTDRALLDAVRRGLG
jgi:chitinase